MPWRVGKSSANQLYFRILSEFMLQQTQVKTVIPYFEKFTNKFPNLKSLAKSNEKQILKLWEGLGYYRRAKNLLASSKILVNEYNSILPKDINEIKKLPGVGDYTANVLLALIYNKRTIAFDGNVKRVFSSQMLFLYDECRFFYVKRWVFSARRRFFDVKHRFFVKH